MVILNVMKNLLRISFTVIFIAVLSTFATTVASAKTINNSNQFADSTRLDYFENMYKREDYKNYLLSIEYSGSGYNNYIYYYMCLTNDDINFVNTVTASSSCEKMMRYYRNGSDYIVEDINDNSLVINNSVYYTNSVHEKDYINEKLLIALNVGLFSFFLSFIFLKLFRS